MSITDAYWNNHTTIVSLNAFIYIWKAEISNWIIINRLICISETKLSIELMPECPISSSCDLEKNISEVHTLLFNPLLYIQSKIENKYCSFPAV